MGILEKIVRGEELEVRSVSLSLEHRFDNKN